MLNKNEKKRIEKVLKHLDKDIKEQKSGIKRDMKTSRELKKLLGK